MGNYMMPLNKRLIAGILIIALQSIYGQQADTISTEVKAFWDIANENAEYKEKEVYKKPFTESDIKDIAVKLYTATEKDPYGFDRYIKTEHKKYLENAKSDPALIAPSPKKQLILNEIDKIYGEKYGQMIETPFFIRGKLLGQTKGEYHATSGINYTKVILEVMIDDICKGNNFFKKGEKIKIIYLDQWLDYTDFPFQLQNNSEYFIAMRIWGKDRNELCIANFNLNSLAIYSIKDERIEVKDDVFGLGENLDWKTFITTFKEKYILSENEKRRQ